MVKPFDGKDYTHANDRPKNEIDDKADSILRDETKFRKDPLAEHAQKVAESESKK